MSMQRRFAVLLPLVPLVLAASCGGPSSPSGQGVVLKGTVMGMGTASAASMGIAARPTSDAITVTVQENPAITTTVGADGSFTLRGLPDGSFTLLFSSNGTPLGSLVFSAVKPNQEITITVQISGGAVVLLEEQRNGIGHGDVEIEGIVSTVIALNPAGESRFLVNGRTVVARPGQTAIREGNTSRSVADVTVGRRVHVKGSWLPLEGTLQPVLALEIKLQGGDGEDTPKTCMINGGKPDARIELEGTVISGESASFVLDVQGNRATGPVQVDATGAEFQCSPSSGPNAPTPDQCKASVKTGAKVHVRGTLVSCDLVNALVRANKVIVQKPS